MRTAVVITASNRASRGEYADLSGESLAKGLTALGYEVYGPHVVADDRVPNGRDHRRHSLLLG